MKREIFYPANREEWLELRKSDITSTAMAALFDVSPYTTRFELYHAKKNGYESGMAPNSRMEAGQRIEEYAAAEVALRQGWKVERMSEYIRLPSLRIASSFDFKIKREDGETGILEIKAVDWMQHAKWEDGKLPPHFEIQLQHQMLCSGLEWAYLAAFTSIYDFSLYFRQADKDMHDKMVLAATKFWHDVDNNITPKPDFFKDQDVIASIYRNDITENAIQVEPSLIEPLIEKYKHHKSEQAKHEKQADAIKSELHHLASTHSAISAGKIIIDTSYTKDSEGTLITSDMVGTRIGARRGYRKLLIKEGK